MTRFHHSSGSFAFLGALLVLGAAVACGPRLKPVEYEEPPQGSGPAAEDDVEQGGGEEGSSSASSSEGSGSESSGSSEGSGSEAAGTKFSPCGEKKCGAPCTECAPYDENCMEVLVMKQCNAEGACVPAPAECKAAKKSKDKAKK